MSDTQTDDIRARAEFEAKILEELDAGADPSENLAGDEPGDAPPAESVRTPDPKSTSELKPETKPEPTKPEPGPEPKHEPTAAEHAEHRSRGDLRAALRAARQAERQAREALEQANARLAKLAPKEEPTPDPLEEQLGAVRKEFPQVADVIEKIARKTLVEPKTAPAEPDKPAFKPYSLSPEWQETVDDNPTALLWHSTPENSERWEALLHAEASLSKTKAWADKPREERLAKAVSMVQGIYGESGDTAQPTPREPETRPISSLSDLRRGVPVKDHSPSYSGLTNDQIMADLDRYDDSGR